MNVWDLVILAAVAVSAALAIRSVWKNRGKGCPGSCAGCTRACGRKSGSL